MTKLMMRIKIEFEEPLMISRNVMHSLNVCRSRMYWWL